MRTNIFAAIALSLAMFMKPAFAGKIDDTLNVAFDGEVTTMDNYKEPAREGLILARLVYNGLLYKDNKTGEFKPDLALSYRFANDTTIDFELRHGVKFHNGQELTADDVVYTLNMVSSSQYNARYQIAVNWIESAEKTGLYSVRLHMKKPYPLALEMLAGNLPIYSKSYYEQVGTVGMGTQPIGTGPYRLVEMSPGTRFVFERFDDYFADGAKSKAKIKHLIVRVLPEANTQYAELLTGKLDWIWRVPPDEARKLAGRSNVEVQSTQILRFAYLGMNPNVDDGKGPLADIRVRQAINHAINRPGIVKALVGGSSQVINTACNPIQFGCPTDVKMYNYDPAKAKSLLAEAGYGAGFPLALLASGIPRQQIEVIASDLGKVGISTTINEQQFAPALSAWRNGAAPVLLTNWGSYGIADAGLSTGVFFGGTGDDAIKNPDLIALINEVNTSVDREKRQSDLSKAVKIIAEQAYWAPLWTYNVNCAQSKDLNFTLDADEFAQFYDAIWK